MPIIRDPHRPAMIGRHVIHEILNMAGSVPLLVLLAYGLKRDWIDKVAEDDEELLRQINNIVENDDEGRRLLESFIDAGIVYRKN